MDINLSPEVESRHLVRADNLDEYFDIMNCFWSKTLYMLTGRKALRDFAEIGRLVNRPSQFPHEIDCSVKELFKLSYGAMENGYTYIATEALAYLSSLATEPLISDQPSR